MGAPYALLDKVNLTTNQDNIVVEIGSEKGEGSSLWLHNWAKFRNIEFYSIDVEHDVREQNYPDINWIVASSGSEWCKNSLPRLDKKLKFYILIILIGFGILKIYNRISKIKFLDIPNEV